MRTALLWTCQRSNDVPRPVFQNVNVSIIDNHKPMVEDENKNGWVFPHGRNALTGASLVYEGIGIIVVGLFIKVVFWEESGSTLIMSMIILFGIALILYGSVLVVRYDDHGNPRIPGQEDATGESPPAYYVREPDREVVYKFSPMQPDPVSTPPYQTYPTPAYSYPPIPTGRPEPGRCVECGGKLFLGRENCPHCGTAVSHLDLNDG